jgi:protein required for attachment to host cells
MKSMIWRLQSICRRAVNCSPTDRGGPSIPSEPRRHAQENPTDPHRLLKRDFASKVVDELRRAMLGGRFDRIVLVAPPGFLGDLRELLPKDLKDKVADEITSDLTNMPEQQLQTHLKAILGRSTSG